MAKVLEGVAVGGLSGRAGNAVFVKTPRGTILRDRPLVVNPRTVAQVQARERLSRASRAFQNLSSPQLAAWRDASEREGLSAQQLFNRLAVRFLAVNPGGAIPALPPASAFPGDGVRVSAAALMGALDVTADRANAPGVVTEVLLQRLPGRNCRTYLEKYRTAGFFAFTAGQTVRLSAAPGPVAVATRFVFAATGQSTELIEWGVVVVGG